MIETNGSGSRSPKNIRIVRIQIRIRIPNSLALNKRKISLLNETKAYERPENPELVVKTIEKSVEECVQQIVAVLQQHQILPKMRPLVGRCCVCVCVGRGGEGLRISLVRVWIQIGYRKMNPTVL